MGITVQYVTSIEIVPNGPYESLVYLVQTDITQPKCRVVNGCYQFNTEKTVTKRLPSHVTKLPKISKKQRNRIII